MYSFLISKDSTLDKEQDISIEINRLMDTYGRDVLRTAYMYLKDEAGAEDAFQEVFYRVYKNLKGFRGESSEKTWIIRITINVCKDMLRSSWMKRVLLTDKIKSRVSGQDIESGVIRRDESRLLFDEVLALKPVFKEVIILFYYQSLDTAEISRALGVPEGTVRSRLHRAREILKSRIGGRFDIGE